MGESSIRDLLIWHKILTYFPSGIPKFMERNRLLSNKQLDKKSSPLTKLSFSDPEHQHFAQSWNLQVLQASHSVLTDMSDRSDQSTFSRPLFSNFFLQVYTQQSSYNDPNPFLHIIINVASQIYFKLTCHNDSGFTVHLTMLSQPYRHLWTFLPFAIVQDFS